MHAPKKGRRQKHSESLDPFLGIQQDIFHSGPSHHTAPVSWVDTTKWVSSRNVNCIAAARAVLHRTFTQHNEVKTFKRPVISLMLLARAVSYRARARYSASTHTLTHPKALPLLMCSCSGKNKTGIWNGLQKLIRYLARFKEQQARKKKNPTNQTTKQTKMVRPHWLCPWGWLPTEDPLLFRTLREDRGYWKRTQTASLIIAVSSEEVWCHRGISEEWDSGRISNSFLIELWHHGSMSWRK